MASAKNYTRGIAPRVLLGLFYGTPTLMAAFGIAALVSKAYSAELVASVNTPGALAIECPPIAYDFKPLRSIEGNILQYGETLKSLDLFEPNFDMLDDIFAEVPEDDETYLQYQAVFNAYQSQFDRWRTGDLLDKSYAELSDVDLTTLARVFLDYTDVMKEFFAEDVYIYAQLDSLEADRAALEYYLERQSYTGFCTPPAQFTHG